MTSGALLRWSLVVGGAIAIAVALWGSPREEPGPMPVGPTLEAAPRAPPSPMPVRPRDVVQAPPPAAPEPPEPEPPAVDTGEALHGWEQAFAVRAARFAEDCDALDHMVLCEEGICSVMLAADMDVSCPPMPPAFDFFPLFRVDTKGKRYFAQYWSSIDPDAAEPSDVLEAWMSEPLPDGWVVGGR